jgi:UPF0716 family protein affecting phage T7 exclusion
LLLIPGFITDVVGLLLLIGPLRRLMGTLLLRALAPRAAGEPDEIVDLTPDQWRQVPDPQLRDQRARKDEPGSPP